MKVAGLREPSTATDSYTLEGSIRQLIEGRKKRETRDEEELETVFRVASYLEEHDGKGTKTGDRAADRDPAPALRLVREFGIGDIHQGKHLGFLSYNPYVREVPRMEANNPAPGSTRTTKTRGFPSPSFNGFGFITLCYVVK